MNDVLKRLLFAEEEATQIVRQARDEAESMLTQEQKRGELETKQFRSALASEVEQLITSKQAHLESSKAEQLDIIERQQVQTEKEIRARLQKGESLVRKILMFPENANWKV